MSSVAINPPGLSLATIRHELRTPVNHVIGYVEMLRERRGLPESFLDDLKKIHRSGRELLQLLNGFFDEEVPDSTEDLHKVCHDLRTPVNHMIGYAQILIEEAQDLSLPDAVADLQRICVAARQWLDLMEHYLVNESAPPVMLETRNAIPGDPVRDKWAEAKLPEEHGRILIIDDDEHNRDILARRLEQSGHYVDTAENGQTGLALLESEEFDLVLLDMIMPGLGGTDVLKQMKNRRKLRDIPVIVISALDDQEGIAECIELGAEDYLSKPFRPAILHARINSSLEKRRLRQEENNYLKRLQEEQARSDRLLLNILPAAVAERLKSSEDASIADHFENVTVLFADLVDFTTLAATETPERVVEILNQIFSSFDVLAERRGLEKIKTIGDAYMAVGGLPVPRADHAEAAARFAIDMLEEIEHFSLVCGLDISLRVGIDSGPVIAGIIGRNKFTYDLWGDTVNTASRMESLGLPGCVQVTSTTRELLRDKFVFRERGEIDVKGKGRMVTWLLET